MTTTLKGAALTALLLLDTMGSAFGATYYVSPTGRDTNPGTLALPFLTGDAAAGHTHPGDTVDFLTGTYPPLHIRLAGAPGAYITYQAAPGANAVITKDGTAWAGINVMAGANYVTISHLRVLGNARSITYAQATAANTSNYTTNGQCIATAKLTHHVNILNNTVEYCPGSGITDYSDYTVIQGNIVAYNAYWSKLAESGIKAEGSNAIPGQPGTMIVANNTVYGNRMVICNPGTGVAPNCRPTDASGIIVDQNLNYDPPNGYQGRVSIYNNIVYQNYGWGFVVFLSQHVDVYNNTTWDNGQGAALPAPYTCTGGEIFVHRSNDVRVENNIFYGPSSALPGFIGWGTVLNSNTTTNLVWDYNVIYTPPGGQPVYPYYPNPTFGPHDTFLDPKFLMASPPPQAFYLTEGSPAIGSGTSALTPATDFAGVRRNPARIDRGAYYGWH